MNYVLQNIKLIIVTLGLSSIPAIYFAKKPPTMSECRAEFSRESHARDDEMLSKIKVGDGQHF